jgi:hypothetical protein
MDKRSYRMSTPPPRDWLELARQQVAATPNSCFGLLQSGQPTEACAATGLARQMTERLHVPTLLLRPEAQSRRAGDSIASGRPEPLAVDLDIARWQLPVRRGELTAIPMNHLAELAKWKQRYRMILIDLQGVNSPWGSSVGRLCDQVWLLYRLDEPRCRRAAAGMQRLAAAGVPIEGRIRLCEEVQPAEAPLQPAVIAARAA